jgi:hypothetical protein
MLKAESQIMAMNIIMLSAVKQGRDKAVSSSPNMATVLCEQFTTIA